MREIRRNDGDPAPAEPSSGRIAVVPPPAVRRDVRVCFAGDSLVAGTGDGTARGWVGRIAAAAIAAGVDLTAYNLGVRGATSVQVARRLAIEARPRLTVGEARVVVSFGVNDTLVEDGRRRATTEQALDAFRRIRSTMDPIPVLLVGPPAVDDDDQNARISDLDAALAVEAAVLGVPFVTTFALTAVSEAWRRPIHAGDGFHPDAAGYALLASHLTPPLLAWLA